MYRDQKIKKDGIPLLDHYNDVDCTLEFLLTPPACFILVGKPFSGKTTIAKKLADDWNCPLINPDLLVEEAIKNNTEIGMMCKECLESGLKIEQDVVLLLLKTHLENSSELANIGYVLDGFPTLSDVGMSTADQMSMIANFPLKPNVVIYVKMCDEDIMKRRKNSMVDVSTGTFYVQEEIGTLASQLTNLVGEVPLGDYDELTDEEDDEVAKAASQGVIELSDTEEAEFELLDETSKTNLVFISKGLLQQTAKDLGRFQKKLPILENFLADYARSMVIELNGNIPPKTLYKGLLTTLSMLPLYKPVRPIILSQVADFDLEDIADLELDRIYFFLNRVQMCAPFFRWQRGSWSNYCPVHLKNGSTAIGKLIYSAVYLDALYFMADEKALKQFEANPRPYLLPPLPIHPCKFIIFGHLKTGKTDLCHRIAAKYSGKVIDYSEIITTYRNEIERQNLHETWYRAVTKIIAEIQAREILKVAVKAEAARAARMFKLADKYATSRAISQRNRQTKSRESYKKVVKSKTGKIESETSYIAFFQEATESAEILQQLEDREKPLEYPLVDADHPEVVAVVDDAIRVAEETGIPLTNDDYMEQILKEIEYQRIILSNYGMNEIRDGGWVFDNLPSDPEVLLTLLKYGMKPAVVVILRDPTENYTVVSGRWWKTRKLKQEREADDVGGSEASEETKSEPMPEFDLLEEIAYGEEFGEEEEMDEISGVEEDEIVVLGPKLTERDIALKKLNEELVKQSDFFNMVPDLLPSDGTVRIIAIEIANNTKVDESLDKESEDINVYDQLFTSNDEFGSLLTIPSDYQSEKTKSELLTSQHISPAARMLHKNFDDIVAELFMKLQAEFIPRPRPSDRFDHEQEDDDAAHNVGLLLQSGETVGADKFRLYGDTSHYCPVELEENWVLCPGLSETETKFKDRSYFFKSEAAREMFMNRPYEYVSFKEPLKPPPIRLCIVGSLASGKSTQSRLLASKINVFHINFYERLQELLFAKAGRKLGFPYQVDQEQIELDDLAIDAESRIESVVSSLGALTTPTVGSLDLSQKSVPNIESETDKEDVENEFEGDEEEEEEEEEEDEEDEDDENDDEEEMENVLEMPIPVVRLKSASVSKTLNQESIGVTDVAGERFTDEEKQVKQYLQSGTPLSASILENLLSDWWKLEPFRSTGFILDGFPNTAAEAQYMMENSYIPDAIVILSIDDLDAIQRLLGYCMEKWHERTNEKQMKKEERKRRAKAMRDAAIAARVKELTEEVQKPTNSDQLTRKGSANNDIESNQVVETEETAETIINDIIAEEFPEPEEIEEEEEELVEDAELRYSNDLLQKYQEDEEKMETILETFETAQVPCYTIDGKRKVEKISQSVEKAIKKFYDNRLSIFESTFSMTLELANKLINSGYKARSKFGMWCPVQVSEGAIIPPRYTDQYQPLAVMHRHHIYYLSSESTRERFMENPIRFIQQPMPNPIVPINVAIVGTPKAGKTTLAKRFVKEFDLIRFTMGDAIRYILKKLPSTFLADEINECLLMGQSIPPALMAAAINEILMHPSCQRRGMILDGLPNSIELGKALQKKNVIPFCILELRLGLDETIQRSETDKIVAGRNFPYPDSINIVKICYEAACSSLVPLRTFYHTIHHNWITLDAKFSKWWLWNQASTRFIECTRTIQKYIVATHGGHPVGIANLGVTTEEFKSRLGAFDYYCPVCLAINSELLECNQFNDNQFAVDYNKKFYSTCCNEHLEMFLAEPDIFLPPKAPKSVPPPSDRPISLTLEKTVDFEDSRVGFGGFCPVTYLQGFKTYESLVKGKPEYAVMYCNRIYYMANKEKRNHFMRKSEQYINFKLPHKQPQQIASVDLKAIPILGYLEQTVATALVKALTAVGERKPKYPFLDTTTSAALFVAYHLKAFNPQNTGYGRKKYRMKLQEYEKHCSLLRYVAENMSLTPGKRGMIPDDFDDKLSQLFALKPPYQWMSRTSRIRKPSCDYC